MIRNKHIILMVEDNGDGFIYHDGMTFAGNGLYKMKERSRLQGGTFDLESAPDKGTTIRIKIPLTNG
jgi:signal transduction histidine kinase